MRAKWRQWAESSATLLPTATAFASLLALTTVTAMKMLTAFPIS
jgi:hypothetical protein